MTKLEDSEYLTLLEEIEPVKKHGKVVQVIGLTIEAQGPNAKLGELCLLYPSRFDPPIEAEVVGFKENKIMLMPLSDLAQVGPGCLVVATGVPLQIRVGPAILGKILDGTGKPLDDNKLPKGLKKYSTTNTPPNPLKRPRIDKPLEVGVRAIDGLLTVGQGQRIGVFAGSGVGKSTLMGMIARNTEADVNVIALIGERGREVRDFIERDLGPEGLKNSVVVAATSDQTPMQRIKGALTATAIAEYFRDQGKNVMLMMDSVTRFAMAQREVGLAVGEPPTSKGYTPSVFALLPRLLERSGTSAKGSITAFYTVLVDGDDMNEPIADAVRGILDGHIVLDRKLAQKGQFPAINIMASVSRIMNEVTTRDHQQAATELKRLLAAHDSAEDLINIGAYKSGANKEIDEAIRAYPLIREYLQQDIYEKAELTESVDRLARQFGGAET
ncbi:flagellar protein export ATPase FliI [Planococcus maritimus]|uniref:flagellar protein export ATPase FliI n=1 Tax=Planococcus maritimus TaxID=192421 RepID=UPI00079B4093|nr:flagellar protein export ATPase FliI [Planococcus maritimus]KYG57861.1 EscN/YscN/HrcN family type III secretion system ATPase [Planococcus maritimus]OED31613.1 flagellar protein export ATPase FliI [Planococcus maritimus]